MLAAHGGANQRRMGAIARDEFQQTFKSMPDSVMAKTIESKSFAQGYRPSSDAVHIHCR